MKRRTVLLCLFVLAALVFLGFWEEITNEPFRCWMLRRSILSSLDDASSVRIIEHTCRYDSVASAHDPTFKEKILAVVTLSHEQIDSLRAAIPQSRDISGTSFRPCIFEERHRVEIVEKSGKVFVIHLCFHCGELIVNDSAESSQRDDGERIMPIGWPERLAAFFMTLGLHPSGTG